jgi:DNA repair exonuclease SbcCD nuclease subunit
MINFIHSADIQVGITGVGVGSLAKHIQEARIESLKTILKLGAEKNVGFVIIAGDLFETNQVSKTSIISVVKILENASPLRILILPGNHDYYGPNSIYLQDEFLHLSKHIRVFTERKPYVIPDLDVTLYPSPCFETRSTESPISWIKKQSGTKYHIAVVHGSIPSRFGGKMGEDEYFPMDEKVLKNLGMDYIALGHWHSLHPDPKEEPESTFFYSGTPEPTGFGEKLSGFALLVDLDEASRKVTAISTSKYQFIDIQKTIASSTDTDSIQTELLKVSQP